MTVKFADHGLRDDTSATVPCAAQVSHGERRFFGLWRSALSRAPSGMVQGLMSRRCLFRQGHQDVIFERRDQNGHQAEDKMCFNVFTGNAWS